MLVKRNGEVIFRGGDDIEQVLQTLHNILIDGDYNNIEIVKTVKERRCIGCWEIGEVSGKCLTCEMAFCEPCSKVRRLCDDCFAVYGKLYKLEKFL